MELSQAFDIASRIRESVTGCTSRAEIAGSVRRKKPQVKDIELCAVVEDYEKLFVVLCESGRFIKPGVPDVIDWPPVRGAKYLRLMLNEDIKLDLFIASPENWGGIFTMRTGSAVDERGNVWGGFIPTLFKRLKQVTGGCMSGGQPLMPDGRLVPVPEERDFFDLCRVEWIEPELRKSASAVKRIK